MKPSQMPRNPIALETFGATARTRLGNGLARLGLQRVRRIRERPLCYKFCMCYSICKSQLTRGAVWDHTSVQQKKPYWCCVSQALHRHSRVLNEYWHRVKLACRNQSTGQECWSLSGDHPPSQGFLPLCLQLGQDRLCKTLSGSVLSVWLSMILPEPPEHE